MRRIGAKRRRRLRTVGEPHPWEPRNMRLTNTRYAETIGDPRGRRNAAFGVVRHLWRSPVPFVGFYPPEGIEVAGQRLYVPAPPKLVDDSEYLAGVEAHKQTFAEDLQKSILAAGNLPGYFEVPTDEGWNIVMDLPEERVRLSDAWGFRTEAGVAGDLAPFVWAYRRCGFCLLSVFDKDLGEIRDDLLFVAKRQGVELRWRRSAA